MTSLAQQSLAELGGRASVLARQRREHIELDDLLNRLERLPPTAQAPVLLRIYRLVFPHAFAEESVLWPVMRRLLPDGEALTLKVELEHQEINELVTRLESLAPWSGERQDVLHRVVALLRQDIRDEEDELLPRLQRRLTSAQLRRLGLAWDAVRRAAPTRAHPIVARRPPGNVLAALPLSILDRSRDRVDAWCYRGAGAGAPALRALSFGLSQAAHAIERLPGVRLGEDPATRVRGPSEGRWLVAAIAAAAAASAILVMARRNRSSRAAQS